MFRSSSYHTIDAKGRIIIPARFREVIRDNGGDVVWITRFEGCLYGFAVNEWQALEKKLLANQSESLRDFKRVFIGNACPCTCDKQERILIPPNLRQYAALEKDIALVGILEHFEIWNRERWDDKNENLDIELAKNGDVKEQLALMGL